MLRFLNFLTNLIVSPSGFFIIKSGKSRLECKMAAVSELTRDKDGFLKCKYCPRRFLTELMFENQYVLIIT